MVHSSNVQQRQTVSFRQPDRSSRLQATLAAEVEINGLKALVLFNSRSTMDSITPEFAFATKAKQIKLEDQVILQLGCVGSWSKISYGTKVPINLCGIQDQIYLDLVNIYQYNCIIGTPFMSRFEITRDISSDKTVPTISPNDRKAIEKLIKKLTIWFWASRNIRESKWSAQKNILSIGRPQANTQSLVNSKDPYVILNIPKLREWWFNRNSNLLGPIPLKLPPFREINHRISLIYNEARHNYYMPRCPKALQEELWEKITRYVTARWWEMKPIYQATPLLCMPKKNRKLWTVVEA